MIDWLKSVIDIKIFSHRLVLGGWIFWSCVFGDLGLFGTIQEAKADVDFCLQVLGQSNSVSPFQNELRSYLKKLNTALSSWSLPQDQSPAGLKHLKNMSAELDGFVAGCSGSPLLSENACQNSKKKLDSLFIPPSTLCTSSKPWYRRFYFSFSSQVFGYFQWIKGFLGFSKKTLTPLMLASCLGNTKSLQLILKKDPKAFYQKDWNGRTIFHYLSQKENTLDAVYFSISHSKADWLAQLSADPQLKSGYDQLQNKLEMDRVELIERYQKIEASLDQIRVGSGSQSLEYRLLVANKIKLSLARMKEIQTQIEKDAFTKTGLGYEQLKVLESDVRSLPVVIPKLVLIGSCVDRMVDRMEKVDQIRKKFQIFSINHSEWRSSKGKSLLSIKNSIQSIINEYKELNLESEKACEFDKKAEETLINMQKDLDEFRKFLTTQKNLS